jgi:hypothetical protein
MWLDRTKHPPPQTVPPTPILIAGGDLDNVAIVHWVDRMQAWGNNWRAPFPYEWTHWMPVPEFTHSR